MNQQLLPHFANESEEAQWWYDQREGLTAKAEEAASRGELQLRHIPSSGGLTHPVKSVILHLSEQDLLRIRNLAKEHGLPEEAYLTMLLHEALDTKEAATK